MGIKKAIMEGMNGNHRLWLHDHARGKLKGGGNGDAKLKSLLGNGNEWCSLLDFLSHWIVGASICQHVPENQTRKWRWCARLFDA